MKRLYAWIKEYTGTVINFNNETMKRSVSKKNLLIVVFSGGILLVGIAWFVIIQIWYRTQVEFNIHINKEAIYLSAYSEPPQFAIWLEDPESGKLKQVFVTYRAGESDWEGKAAVPIAIPHWSDVFGSAGSNEQQDFDGVSGATPKDEYFRVRAEVKPGSEWICWIEMNLAGDYNEFYPFFNRETFQEDEYSCGQPALIYNVRIKADKGSLYIPKLSFMSLWKDGINKLAPVDSTITTARDIFDNIDIRIITPKLRLIDRYKIKEQNVLKELTIN